MDHGEKTERQKSHSLCVHVCDSLNLVVNEVLFNHSPYVIVFGSDHHLPFDYSVTIVAWSHQYPSILCVSACTCYDQHCNYTESVFLFLPFSVFFIQMANSIGFVFMLCVIDIM